MWKILKSLISHKCEVAVKEAKTNKGLELHWRSTVSSAGQAEHCRAKGAQKAVWEGRLTNGLFTPTNQLTIILLLPQRSSYFSSSFLQSLAPEAPLPPSNRKISLRFFARKSFLKTLYFSKSFVTFLHGKDQFLCCLSLECVFMLKIIRIESHYKTFYKPKEGNLTK